jgi:hypothetical protein
MYMYINTVTYNTCTYILTLSHIKHVHAFIALIKGDNTDEESVDMDIKTV